MLKVEMTPNLLGFKISGDYAALDELYDAIWDLTIADGDFPEDKRMHGTENEQIMSIRLLALCYDIRHAYQGSRGIELVDSGMSEWDAKYHDLPLVEKNVIFSVEVLYPEAMFEALALNYLMAKRASLQTGVKTMHIYDKWPAETLLDGPSCVVRAYLAKLLAAVKKHATPGRFSRIRKEVATEFHFAAAIYGQWVDLINNDFAGMTKKQRAEGLSTVVRDLAECYRHDQYLQLERDIDAAAEANGTTRDNIEIPGLYSWDEPEW